MQPERPITLAGNQNLHPHDLMYPLVSSDLCGLQDDGEIYMAYTMFLAQAMSDWAVRTEDPSQANFFLM